MTPSITNSPTSSISHLPIGGNITDIMAYVELMLVQEYDAQLKDLADTIKQNTRLKEYYRNDKKKLNELLNNEKKGDKFILNKAENDLLENRPKYQWDATKYNGLGGVNSNHTEKTDISSISNNDYRETTFDHDQLVAANETFFWHGDPHIGDPDGQGKITHDVQGQANGVYNYLSDSNLQLLATHVQSTGNTTVVGRTEIIVQGAENQSNVVMEHGQVPTINGERMQQGLAYSLADQGQAIFDGNKLTVTTAEGYTIEITDYKTYLDGKVTSGGKGVASDGVDPNGLGGQLFDSDNETEFEGMDQTEIETFHEQFLTDLPQVNGQTRLSNPQNKEYLVDVDQIKAVIENCQSDIDALNSSTELSQTELSTLTSQRKLAFETLSSMISKMFDASSSVIRNIK